MISLSFVQENIIKLIGTITTILGDTFTPLVSSSKNRKRPALDAGNGLLFYQPMNQTLGIYHKNFWLVFHLFDYFY